MGADDAGFGTIHGRKHPVGTTTIRLLHTALLCLSQCHGRQTIGLDGTCQATLSTRVGRMHARVRPGRGPFQGNVQTLHNEKVPMADGRWPLLPSPRDHAESATTSNSLQTLPPPSLPIQAPFSFLSVGSFRYLKRKKKRSLFPLFIQGRC